MDVALINPFLNAVINVLSTMAQTAPKAGKPSRKSNNQSWGVVTGIIGMAGNNVSGNMVLSFDQPAILGIVNRMLMEKFTEINSDVVDAVGELTNMISGGAKRDLSEKGFNFNMATPIMIVGKGIEITQLTKSPIIQVPFTTQDGEFVLEANLATTPASK